MFSQEAKKGFSVGNIIAVVVGIIVMVAVAVPITTSVITAQNFTAGSTNKIIADIVPTLILVGVILLVVSLYSSN
jgi:Na+-driven multidrug efflux pump